MAMFKWIRKSLGLQEDLGGTHPAVNGIDVYEDAFKTIYAIGDIHGRHDLLKDAEGRIEADIGEGQGALVIYLGDYIDRGPSSAQVLEHLLNPLTPRFTRLCLRGNHDDVFLRFLESPLKEEGWLDFGGRETLLSYNLDPRKLRDAWGDPLAVDALLRRHIPETHRALLRAMPLFARWSSYLFVHAGLKPRVPLHKQDPYDLLWIREPFLSAGPDLPMTVVHGHTPQETISYGPNRIGIDTGAYATGRLTVLKVTAEGAFPLPG